MTLTLEQQRAIYRTLPSCYRALRLVLPTTCFAFLVVTAFRPSKLPFSFPANKKRLTKYILFNSIASNEGRKNQSTTTREELVPIVHHPEKKPFRRKQQKQPVDRSKLIWLQQATDQLLQQAGTWPEGKWHEAMSLFQAWATFQKELGCDAAYRMETTIYTLQ
jgi:hypothetical protein